MKTIERIPALVTILLLLMVGSLLIQGCEKPEPPGSEPVFYTMSTLVKGKGSISPDKLSGIVLGSNVSIKLTPDADYSTYSVKVNGIKIDDVIPFNSEFVLDVKNIKSNTKIEVEFVETNILLISVKSINEKPWMIKKIEFYSVDGNRYLRDANLDPRMKSDKFYFLYPSMDIVVYQEDGGTRKGSWGLTGMALKLDGDNLTLRELTSSVFSYNHLSAWSEYEQCMIYPKFIYERN